MDVRNTAGEPIAPSSVTSGGTQACDLIDYGRYVCWERWKATHYEIVVWHGGRRKTQSVQLGWDGCHVVGHGHLELRF